MKKKISGFSLLELMITLIIISILIAALAPVITKKLKSNGTTINNSAANDITTNCANNENFGPDCKLCTKKYCIDCGLTQCSGSQYVDNKRCECKNCADKYTSLCAACNSTGCIRCNNSSYYINNGTCVLCPTGSYCDGENIYATCPGDGYWCDSSGIHKCTEKYSSTCTACTSSACTKCATYFFLSGGVCKSCSSKCAACTSESYCTKCDSSYVLDTSQHNCTQTCASAISGCIYCNSSTECTGCNGNYYLNTSKTCSTCSIANCSKCIDNRSASSPACQVCSGGYYIDSNGTCSLCSSKFGTNCTACNANQCLSCAQNYHLNEITSQDACEADDNKFNCSDSNFMQIGELCVTRRNMGDSNSLPIPPSVITIEAGSGETCYSAHEKCCWKGQTGTQTACDSENGGYSGCTRTVCNWEAAKEICASFNYNGKTWRLATKEEFSNLAYNYSIGMGANGLMLCDNYSKYNSARCSTSYNCQGSYDNCCYLHHIWTGSTSGALNAYYYNIRMGAWNGPFAKNTSMAFGVRCVSEN